MNNYAITILLIFISLALIQTKGKFSIYLVGITLISLITLVDGSILSVGYIIAGIVFALFLYGIFNIDTMTLLTSNFAFAMITTLGKIMSYESLTLSAATLFLLLSGVLILKHILPIYDK